MLTWQSFPNSFLIEVCGKIFFLTCDGFFREEKNWSVNKTVTATWEQQGKLRKKILAQNLLIYIGLHCVNRSLWIATTLATLIDVQYTHHVVSWQIFMRRRKRRSKRKMFICIGTSNPVGTIYCNGAKMADSEKFYQLPMLSTTFFVVYTLIYSHCSTSFLL